MWLMTMGCLLISHSAPVSRMPSGYFTRCLCPSLSTMLVHFVMMAVFLLIIRLTPTAISTY